MRFRAGCALLQRTNISPTAAGETHRAAVVRLDALILRMPKASRLSTIGAETWVSYGSR
jgi:hypothetical protein